MNWKTLALGCAIAGVGCFAGCGGPTNSTTDANVPQDTGLNETHVYVIGMIDAETDGSDPTAAYGFNLDMADGNPAGAPAGGCQDQPDYTSPVTGTSGVDNQLANLAPTLDGLLNGDGVNGAIRDQIEAGKVLLMLEVSDINSYTNDSSVMVRAVLGEVQPEGPACMAHSDQASCEGDTANMCSWTANMSGGGACSTSVAPDPSTTCPAHTDQASCEGDQANACNWSGTNNACSGIAAGQTFHMLQALGSPVAGSITNGQLRATTSSVPLSFVAMGTTVTLTLHDVTFAGRITADTIVNGEFGASILISELMQTVHDLGFDIDITTFVAPDLQPSPTDPNTCMALSAGMAYAAISAHLE